MGRVAHHRKRVTVLGKEKVSASGVADRNSLSLPTEVRT